MMTVLLFSGVAAAGVLAAVASMWLPRLGGLAALLTFLPLAGFALSMTFC
jgi:hypothetical protein